VFVALALVTLVSKSRRVGVKKKREAILKNKNDPNERA
jgi:hypothetical protein